MFGEAGQNNRKSRRIDFLFLALVIAVSISVYLNALGDGLVYDDRVQLVENPMIRSLGNIPRFFTSDVWGFYNGGLLGHSNYYRPVMHTVNALLYHFVI